MRLREFRVRGFRCIHDTGRVPVGDLAALIGKNESGKTALLQALLHLNLDNPVSYLDRCDQMWEAFENDPGIRIVEGVFELSQGETNAVTDVVLGAPSINRVLLYRCADGEVQYEFPAAEFGTREEADAETFGTFSSQLDELSTVALPKVSLQFKIEDADEYFGAG
jgi:AAA ATPase domain